MGSKKEKYYAPSISAYCTITSLVDRNRIYSCGKCIYRKLKRYNLCWLGRRFYRCEELYQCPAGRKLLEGMA